MSHCFPFGDAEPSTRELHFPNKPVRVSEDHVRKVCRLAETWLGIWTAQIRETIKLPSGAVFPSRMDRPPEIEADLKRRVHNAMMDCIGPILKDKWRWSEDAVPWTYIYHIECENQKLTPIVRRFFLAAYNAFLNEVGRLIPEKSPRVALDELKAAWEEAERVFNAPSVAPEAPAVEATEPHEAPPPPSLATDDKPPGTREPDARAFAAYRTARLTGAKQADVARKIGVSQSTVSRSIREVAEWIKAGNVLPPEMAAELNAQPSRRKPTPMDPRSLEQGPRQAKRRA